jgi:hypothetical protein
MLEELEWPISLRVRLAHLRNVTEFCVGKTWGQREKNRDTTWVAGEFTVFHASTPGVVFRALTLLPTTSLIQGNIRIYLLEHQEPCISLKLSGDHACPRHVHFITVAPNPCLIRYPSLP